ncbi:MAG: LPS export ABC transporter periplasmic protein LptC [Candidatus Omnitrophica bacterium]|nr:LPS export ABC transporter periplasmic protein LptC [Candidatus Omnitrophota bacterium]
MNTFCLRKTFILILTAAGIVSFAGCTRKTLPATGGVPGSPGDAVSTFTLVGHTETGRRKWEIQGDTADLMAERVELSPVRAVSFGQVEIRLSAQTGEYDKSARIVHLEGDVVVTTSDGAELTTHHLDWAQDRETGTTSDPVRVTRPGMIVTGTGGLGRPKIKQVRLQREITVILQDAKGKTVITCDGPLEVDYGRHKARFWKNVLVRDAQGWIRSDRMDAALDPKTNQMAKAVFWGHVRIDHGGETAAANRAEYWQPLHRMQLMGHPKLVMLPEESPALE